ncbi:hypothetical protein [Novipirellula rosea]|uniref:hypothetical protein n=1 Tax=Novipirellula rosea TaxID=1031540 RepID=UPI0030EF2255
MNVDSEWKIREIRAAAWQPTDKPRALRWDVVSAKDAFYCSASRRRRERDLRFHR